MINTRENLGVKCLTKLYNLTEANAQKKHENKRHSTKL